MKISIEQREDCGFRISDRGFKKNEKVENLLWERLSHPELVEGEPRSCDVYDFHGF